MFRRINIAEGRTVDLNGDSIVFIEERDGRAFIRLVDGSEFLTNEFYDEFIEDFRVYSDVLTVAKSSPNGQKNE